MDCLRLSLCCCEEDLCMPIWQPVADLPGLPAAEPERSWNLVIRHAKESLPGSKNELHAAYMSALQAPQLLTSSQSS